MSWTTGHRAVTRVTAGPTLSQTLAAEIAASKAPTKRPEARRCIYTNYQRPSEAIRGEVLRNQIRSLQATEPRNRKERRIKQSMLRSLRKELLG